MTLIEKMAKALWDKMEERLGSRMPWDEVVPSEKEFLMASMRAALAAAREPTEMMMDEAMETRLYDVPVIHYRQDSELIWKAMMDAALEEK